MTPIEEGLLLLCCRLGQAIQPLTPAKYRQLEQFMSTRQPKQSEEQLEFSPTYLASLGYDTELSHRIFALLNRPNQVQEYLSAAPDITAVTRLSERFPQRLRRLGGDCPPVLFCKGDLELLNTTCVSLVGSRLLSPRGRAFAERIGVMAAEEGYTLVSGGANGADSAAQEACLRAGGYVICYVPDELQKHPYRNHVLYCSAEGYDVPFSANRAFQRNRFIHAHGQKTFVAQCPACSGGTWSGSCENLRRKLSEVFMLHDGSEGAAALVELGANYVEDDFPSIGDLLSYQLSIFD